MTDVGALIVASGRGSGFGGAIALGRWRAGTVLEHVASVVRAADIEDITVVLGPMGEDIAEAADLDDATFVIDPDWEEGLSSALRVGLDTMWRSSGLEIALIVEVERPGIDAETISAVLATHRLGSRLVTLPKYRYTRGGPVAVGRGLWPRLMGLEGDLDLVALIDAHKDWAHDVWIDRLGPTLIETSSDLDALSRGR